MTPTPLEEPFNLESCSRGFKFKPTGAQLIQILRNKDWLKPAHSNLVREVDFYRFDPDALQGSYGKTRSGVCYFITKLIRNHGGVRACRETPAGFWTQYSEGKPVVDEQGHPVGGVSRVFSYCEGQSKDGKKTGWMMEEFRLLELGEKLSAPLSRSKSRAETSHETPVLVTLYRNKRWHARAEKVVVGEACAAEEEVPRDKPEVEDDDMSSGIEDV